MERARSRASFTADVRQAEARKAAARDPPRGAPRLGIPPAVHGFLKRFKTFCDQRRLTVTDIFRPYDIAKNGMLPAFKVQACLHSLSFHAVKAEPEQVLLCFSDARKPEVFNYMNFERALENEDITSAEIRATLESPPVPAEIEREAVATCAKIKVQLGERRLRIETMFEGLWEGPIASPEFQMRLGQMHLALRAGQLQALLRKYRFNLTDLVNWREFCGDVNRSRSAEF